MNEHFKRIVLFFAAPACIMYFLFLSLVVAPIILVYIFLFVRQKRPGYDLAGLNFQVNDRTFVHGIVALAIWCFINSVLLIEDFIFDCERKIDEIEEKLISGEIPVAFIIGHGRSGTTNCHHCLLNNVVGAQCARMVHLLRSAFTISLIDRFTWIMERFIAGRSTDNHPIGPHEPIEESFRIGTYGKGLAHVGSSMPSIFNLKDHARKVLDIRKEDIEYIRREIARNLYFLQSSPTIYIGCILEIFDHNLLLEGFGDCSLILLLRDPFKTNFSWLNLLSALWKANPTKIQAETSFATYTKLHYQRMLRIAKKADPRIYSLEFKDWIGDTECEFNKLVSWLKQKGNFKPQNKAEKHQNKKELLNLILSEFIHEEVGHIYNETLSIIADRQAGAVHG